MHSIVKYIAIPAVVLAAACQTRDDSKLDDALSKDLALASQVQPYQPQMRALCLAHLMPSYLYAKTPN